MLRYAGRRVRLILLRLFGCSWNPGLNFQGQFEFDRLWYFAHFVTACLKAKDSSDAVQSRLDSRAEGLEKLGRHRGTPTDAELADCSNLTFVHRQCFTQRLQQHWLGRWHFQRLLAYKRAFEGQFNGLVISGQRFAVNMPAWLWMHVAHSSVGGDQIMPRPRHPVHHLVIFRNVGVEYSKPADHLAPDIRKERIFYFVGLAKPLQNFARVIGYRRSVYSVCLEAFERELQLDELVAAVGSPISAAAEDQQQPVRSSQIVQLPNLTVLVGDGKIGHLLANVRSGPIAVILCLDKLQPVLRRDVRATRSHPADHAVQCRTEALVDWSMSLLPFGAAIAVSF